MTGNSVYSVISARTKKEVGRILARSPEEARERANWAWPGNKTIVLLSKKSKEVSS